MCCLARKLIQAVKQTRNEERQRASEEKRARNLEELRDGAIQFLHRNDIMREQKRINEERDAEIKRK